MEKPRVHYGSLTKFLITINFMMAAVYMAWWFMPGHAGNPILYGLLLLGEVYHVAVAMMFWFTMWPTERRVHIPEGKHTPPVDVYITVAGEPVEIVKETALAAKNLHYPNHKVYILSDAKNAKKDNWQDYEKLAHEIGVTCITQPDHTGAKAGNFNLGLKQTQGELIALFDADMVPHKDLLQKLVPYFADDKVAFVQSPQFYKNQKVKDITEAAWYQLDIFFGAIMKGKDKSNSAFICGTNVVIRRQAIEEAGGMNENNIAEDFLTALAIHQKGWKSHHVTEVLAEGIGPEDLLSYYKQQLRWARGSLEVLFSENPLFKGSLTWAQKIEYLSSALYYFNGVIVLIDIIMPLIFLYFGLQPVNATTTSFAIFFLPFLFLSLYSVYLATGGYLHFGAISFSQSSWPLQLQAVWSILTGKKMGFSVTPKQAQEGNYLFLVYPHLAYIFLLMGGIYVAITRENWTPAVTTNIAWGLFNATLYLPFIKAAFPWEKIFGSRKAPALSYQ